MTATRVLKNRAEIADYLGLTPQALSQASHRGEGPPYFLVGAAIRYDLKEVDAWLESRRVDPATKSPKRRVRDAGANTTPAT